MLYFTCGSINEKIWKGKIMRFIKAIVISMVLSIPMSLTVFAGVWRTGEGVNKDRWWYDNGDGTYANNGW